MKKKLLIVLVIILLALSYGGYKTIEKANMIKDSVQSLTNIDYEKIKSSINNINNDINTNDETISKDNLEEIYDSLVFVQKQYKNISKISSDVSKFISSDQLDSIVTNVNTILKNNIDKDVISLDPENLDSESLNSLNKILDVSNNLSSNFDASKIEEIISDDNLLNIIKNLKNN